ncbi:MAG TPA: DUF420 domain-containing protein [Virgibacillus sp.]|nr:DUF420 domain-containing protein [Virgibacillus sp.]
MKNVNSTQRNYNPLIWILSVIIIAVILGSNYLPRSTDGTIAGVELTILPLFNAIFNGITFILLVCALVMIKKRNIPAHRNFMLSAFGVTLLFFVSYLTYHAMAGSTSFGGDGIVKYIYYAFLISHILLAAILVPLSLITLGRGLNRNDRKHRKIARWTMPIWLYVSLSGVLVYVFISPYY